MGSKYAADVKRLHMSYKIKIKKILKNSNTRVASMTAINNIAQERVQECMQNIHEAHEKKISELQNIINDDSKIRVDKREYEKKQLEYEGMETKLNSTVKRMLAMQAEIDELHHEIEIYSKKQIRKRK